MAARARVLTLVLSEEFEALMLGLLARSHPGPSGQLSVEGDDNNPPLIASEVTDGVLNVGVKDGTTIRPSLPVVCHLSMGDIAGIQHAGLGKPRSWQHPERQP